MNRKKQSSNRYLTSDIKIYRDSSGFFTAEHMCQGILVDSTYHATRAECRRKAVSILNDLKAGSEKES